jgi:hypothetical protein
MVETGVVSDGGHQTSHACLYRNAYMKDKKGGCRCR